MIDKLMAIPYDIRKVSINSYYYMGASKSHWEIELKDTVLLMHQELQFIHRFFITGAFYELFETPALMGKENQEHRRKCGGCD